MSERQPGLDLLRCIALLFVILFHGFLYNGYYYESQTGFAMWLAGSVRWLSVSCIGIFLMLTGYLKSGKTSPAACCRSLLPVLLGYLLAACVSIPIRHFFFGDTRSVWDWVIQLLSFSGVYYGWYVEMYLGLVLLCPFLNAALQHLSHRQILLFAAVLILLTALPGAVPGNLLPDYWRSIYPLTYYVAGAVIRKLQQRISPWVGICTAIGIAGLLGAGTVLSTDDTLQSALTWEFADIWILLICVCLFLGLYQLPFSAAVRRLLAFCSGGCYGGYLLSHLLDAWCYRLLPAWKTPSRYPLLFLAVTLPIYAVSLLAGKLLGKLTGSMLGIARRWTRCR